MVSSCALEQMMMIVPRRRIITPPQLAILDLRVDTNNKLLFRVSCFKQTFSHFIIDHNEWKEVTMELGKRRNLAFLPLSDLPTCPAAGSPLLAQILACLRRQCTTTEANAEVVTRFLRGKMGWSGGIAIFLALSSGAAMLPQVALLLQMLQKYARLSL